MMIYLFRHGQTVYNADGERFCGTSDVGLTALGWQQARRAAQMLSGVRLHAFVHSGLRRAAETAKAIQESQPQLAGARLHVEPAFREVGFGSWEGLTRAEVNKRYPDMYAQWLADPAHVSIPGGDDVTQRQQEVLSAFSRLLVRFADCDIAVVAHNTINRLLLVGLLGSEARHYRRIVQENACMNIIEYSEASGVRIHAVNRLAI
ncbi:alpha-ribazole phosphatase/probable phosphoglycerate mutase [Alicyclobacillus sacchari]|uniref:Alpha-ribazole phosphatase/probable phosphoglycerate mutase n=1 Tax=Alicyclobacillus sacchari TaxID=392010 RepID=A0A4R8LLX9_9BACL|nr:histidine phosphatase family protein [Alicyclobacillus sacchari]TDY46285.1 alpha-ribazole phosphatase/probable phosphoglycerate mutase [Alicyclobacillus sacchari]